ncbi:MAG: helix-turn-helix domain-containing protein [Spirochaetales bacterium]|nr:helix-turn-helix domain-containing protein [Spirochaetales bacterium]
MPIPFLVFSNVLTPLIAGLFFLLYFFYFVLTNPSKAPSYKFFILFLIGFSFFLFGRPLQLLLGPHPLPLIIVNIRLFFLCSFISPVIMLAANIFKPKSGQKKIKEVLIIVICIFLGITYCIFNTLGTDSSYKVFEYGNLTAYDNLTPSFLPPYYGREVTIGVQFITGMFLFIFSFFKLLKLKLETPLTEFIKHKIFLINSGILVFALTFIIGSLLKQWWIFYTSPIISALLFGGGVLADIKEIYNYNERLIPFVKEDIIHNVTFSEFSKKKLIEMLHCLGKKSDPDTFIIIKIKETRQKLSANLKKIDEILILCKKLLYNSLDNEQFLLLPLSKDKIGIILCLLQDSSRQIYILEVLEEIKEAIDKNIGCIVTIGIGRSYQNLEDLRISYYEALKAQEYAEQFNTSGIIHVENINESDKHINTYPVKEKERLLSLIKVGDVENSKLALNEYLSKFTLFINEKPEILKVRLYELVGSLIDSAILGGGDEEKLNSLIQKYFHDINIMKDVELVQKWLTEVVMEIVRIVAAVHKKRSRILVNKAKEFIELHYAQSISYKDAAKEIFISPSYFLSLFKQETGLTFVDYLTRVRINKAREFLLTTELNITEIALKTGFNNANYFSSIFKKIVGTSAKEYRKSIVEQT